VVGGSRQWRGRVVSDRAVIARWRAASATTLTTSGDAPDCEIPITTASMKRGGAS
jgi:hypothetical protein